MEDDTREVEMQTEKPRFWEFLFRANGKKKGLSRRVATSLLTLAECLLSTRSYIIKFIYIILLNSSNKCMQQGHTQGRKSWH